MRALLIILATTFFCLSVKDIGKYTYYVANKAYISANWCVNRLIPDSDCNGKCYLSKSIKEGKSQESDFPIPVPSEQLKQFQFCETAFLLPSVFQVLVKASVPTEVIRNYSYNYTNSIFHPPKFF